MKLTLSGKPIPLQRHRTGYGRVYDPQRKLKDRHCFELKSQYIATLPDTPLSAHFIYYFPLPKNKKRCHQLLTQQYHIARPDLSNLIKYTEDVLVDANIISDDRFIAHLYAAKLYSQEPRTECIIQPMETNHEPHLFHETWRKTQNEKKRRTHQRKITEKNLSITEL